MTEKTCNCDNEAGKYCGKCLDRMTDTRQQLLAARLMGVITPEQAREVIAKEQEERAKRA